MKKTDFIKILSVLFIAVSLVNCGDDDFGNPIYQERCNDGIQNGDETGIDCGGADCPPCSEESQFAGTYRQVDQMGRPGVNMLFNIDGLRDTLNVTIPSKMQLRFKEIFENRINELDTTFTRNTLGLDALEMASLFSADVLWVAEYGQTTYYDGTKILTGRAPGDDVMDANLLWIYGGEDGTKNHSHPKLTSDGVPENDAQFLDVFPYLAPPF